jgi:hypothetical protein
MKQKATARELEDMIKRAINIGGAHLKVHKDPYGFSANVVTYPDQLLRCQPFVNQIVEELREQYELID